MKIYSKLVWDKDFNIIEELSSEFNYQDGELISGKCWDKEGNEVDCDVGIKKETK